MVRVGLPTRLASWVSAISLCSLAFAAPDEAEAEGLGLTCLPPIPPNAALPVEVQQAYRAELVGEFEAYFRDISSYINCLDAERSAVFEEARRATQAYSELLRITSKNGHE